MHRGYVKLFRAIEENPLWFSEPFSRSQAWIDLILIANHKDGAVVVRGNVVRVARGQVGHSAKGLAERWRWSRGKVQRFLNYLENEQQIEQQKSKLTTLITITKYEEYQESGQQTGHQTDIKRTSNGHQTDTNKNGKNDKNGKKVKTITTTIPDDVSEKVWSDFQILRKAKRAPITETVIDGIRREATKAGVTLEVALKTCCERGWQGFKADWYMRDHDEKAREGGEHGGQRTGGGRNAGAGKGEGASRFGDYEADRERFRIDVG